MLLSAFNNVRVGYFRVVFIVILKGLVSFKRKRAIKQRFFLLLIAGFNLIRTKAIN
jgi:hypothetical protein